MKRHAIVLVAALAAGCTYQSSPDLAEAKILSTGWKPGFGEVASVGVLPNSRPEGATSGPSAVHGAKDAYRLFLKMDAGFQTVDVDNPTFMAGQAIEITRDGRIVKVSGTLFNDLFKRNQK